MKFWTSENLIKKWSTRPWDPHNRIRLETLCPKVVSDRQNAGRMPSKRRFLYCCPIRENPALNVNFSPQPWGHFTPRSTIGFGQRILIRSIKWLCDLCGGLLPCVEACGSLGKSHASTSCWVLCKLALSDPPILCQDKMGGVSQPLYASDYDSLPESYCRLGGAMTPGLVGKIDIQTRVLNDRTKMPKSSF